MTWTPLSMLKGQRSRSPGRFTHRGVNASGSCSGERGNVLGVGTYCYVVVCSTAQGANTGRRGAGACRGGHLQFVIVEVSFRIRVSVMATVSCGALSYRTH